MVYGIGLTRLFEIWAVSLFAWAKDEQGPPQQKDEASKGPYAHRTKNVDMEPWLSIRPPQVSKFGLFSPIQL